MKSQILQSYMFLFVFVQIRKLSRWEVIHVVRTMSTEAAKSGEEGAAKLSFYLYLRQCYSATFLNTIDNSRYEQVCPRFAVHHC